ncbi:MAG: 1-deoxy-D-xylulose-5-phosphate synthase N-terminal domain-containing protein [bacterium]|jgi:transketolase|nr:transketolase [candidate division KSB1 bacterium]MDH7560039.1 1-deoxy-D-xylulose-5-phosphate synthase N-terminal domain-containing protein [bacterium]
MGQAGTVKTYEQLQAEFAHWEKIKDMVDQCIDFMLNLRQSGHPGGSRSKVHAFVVTALSGVMRWDPRHPEKRFADRFILVGGHTNPLVYAALAVLNEALRRKYERTKDRRYLIPDAQKRAVFSEDLLTLRRRGGLPGHAEMAGKTLFFKFNTGPSAHGSPVAAGQALALKLAGAEDVRVFAMEGDGGLTPGAAHETQNNAYGLGLNNLFYLIDWNDFGIDDHRISSIVHGSPQEWFAAHGWRVMGTEQGMEWGPVAKTIWDLVYGDNPHKLPNAAWFKTRKGRGYGIFDNKSHGMPHTPMNSPVFWEWRKEFMERYAITFDGYGSPAPATEEERREQTRRNLRHVMEVYDQDPDLVDYVADRLVELGDAIPEDKPSLRFSFEQNPTADPVITDYRRYPAELFAKPGEKLPNRAALAKFGAWVNAYAHQKYGRPLFIAMSADLAESTNIAGFAKKWGDFPGFGVYNRDTNLTGALLPQAITEFANAGICAGLACVNLARDPFAEFNGFYGACSTYGSFVYLKYGPLRLLSQLAQDCDIKIGKVLWVVGHSGPETADDSRTHFGIFAPGVTQLFPEGQVVNVCPWEHNEVPVVIGAALATDAHIIALHLTRPPIEIPDREALGLPSFFEAAKGAYVLRDYVPGQKVGGTIFVQGTSTTSNMIKILPELAREKLNVKIVAAISPELFRLQPASYRESVVSPAEWLDSTVITNAARRGMYDWIAHRVAIDYAMSADWDNRWRTGGTVDEICEEAHISPEWLLRGIERFVRDREKRLRTIRDAADKALQL